jgi:hypothetical protein
MQKNIPLFGKTKFLERQIDEFLDRLAEGAIYFERGITAFLEEGSSSETCEEKLLQITQLKETTKELRRSIANALYCEMLIPDFRGDVLSLLTKLFSLLDAMGKNFQELIIESTPTLPTNTQTPQAHIQSDRKEFLELVKVVVQSVEKIILASRNFFRNPKTVRDYTHQVRVYESEADRLAISLKKKIFKTELKFSEKINLRNIVDAIDAIADQAEYVADQLDIYAIQRTL